MKHFKHKQKSTKLAAAGSIRIIGGLWRSRKLPVIDLQGLRPTGDRIKETLFNWIGFDIAGAHCLDLFAGAGSLGFEAASRQASQVVMVELNKSAYQQLQQNKELLKSDNVEVKHQDALAFLASPERQAEQPFDIVFLDPPFHHDLINQTISKLEETSLLNQYAYIYLEMEKELTDVVIPKSWVLHREKKAGNVICQLYKKQS